MDLATLSVRPHLFDERPARVVGQQQADAIVAQAIADSVVGQVEQRGDRAAAQQPVFRLARMRESGATTPANATR